MSLSESLCSQLCSQKESFKYRSYNVTHWSKPSNEFLFQSEESQTAVKTTSSDPSSFTDLIPSTLAFWSLYHAPSVLSLQIFLFYFFFPFFSFSGQAACGILVPRSGIEPMPPALEAQNLNHWTTREVPCLKYFNLPVSLLGIFPLTLPLFGTHQWIFQHV